MAISNNLRMSAIMLADEVAGAVADNGGHVSGTIVTIKRDLGLGCNNNELRQSLNFLCRWDRMSGMAVERSDDRRKAPLNRRTGMYSYQLLNPEVAVKHARQELLEYLDGQSIPFAGSALQYLKPLKYAVDPWSLNTVIAELRRERLIQAPFIGYSDGEPYFTRYLLLARA